MLTVGVDLGKRKSQYAVLEEGGNLLVERSLPNNPEVVKKFLRSFGGAVQVGCETCSNSYWLVEVVESAGYAIQVAHAMKLRCIAESCKKTDKLDARVIGDLLRIGYFPSIVIPPVEIRRVRELLRGRVKLVQSMARMKNAMQGVLTRAGVEYLKADVSGLGAEAFVGGLKLPEAVAFMARQYLAGVRGLGQQVREVEAELRRQVGPQECWRRVIGNLMTIPGIGEFSAMLLLLELWDVERFANPKKLASYVGIVPAVHQSGQVNRGGPLTKRGNRYVRWILVQDAWIAVRHCARYRRVYEYHRLRQGHPRAIIPVARQLLHDVYGVWKEGVSYEEWIRRHTRQCA